MATKIKMIHPKPMLTVGFYTEYQNKILNEYKFENVIKPVYCFYEPKEDNTFLRFEEYSFDISKNPQVTGKIFALEGLLVHYATQDSYNKTENLEKVFNNLKETQNKYQFILFIYGDLKTFLFRFKFVLLHNKGADYKISKIKKYTDRKWLVKGTSINNGEGIKEGFDWLLSSMINKNEKGIITK